MAFPRLDYASPAMRDVVILGAGYTGARVAERLVARGTRVLATAREEAPLARVAASGADVVQVDAAEPSSLRALAAVATRRAGERAVLCCVPPVALKDHREDRTSALLAQLGRVARVVYLSTTAVYGDHVHVDERTPAAPPDDRSRLRLEAERVTLGGPWSGLVLRAAAIYGPGRGIHTGVMRRALHPEHVVSRIHVDDLAALCVAALGSDVTGAWPVADDEPASPSEIGSFCRSIGVEPGEPPGAGASGRERRVDGRAIRARLGCELVYPSYRMGVLASVS
jgi:nucleoside-diphosphate-sugar epimerase